jgi:hypothetical protein
MVQKRRDPSSLVLPSLSEKGDCPLRGKGTKCTLSTRAIEGNLVSDHCLDPSQNRRVHLRLPLLLRVLFEALAVRLRPAAPERSSLFLPLPWNSVEAESDASPSSHQQAKQASNSCIRRATISGRRRSHVLRRISPSQQLKLLLRQLHLMLRCHFLLLLMSMVKITMQILYFRHDAILDITPP